MNIGSYITADIEFDDVINEFPTLQSRRKLYVPKQILYYIFLFLLKLFINICIYLKKIYHKFAHDLYNNIIHEVDT